MDNDNGVVQKHVSNGRLTRRKTDSTAVVGENMAEGDTRYQVGDLRLAI
jgi:hypothetical protein